LRYEQAIARIKGVVRSTVLLDEHDQITEVHIIASSLRRPKRIVRDVESLLCARFGVRIDYRKVSLVQLDPEEGSDSPVRLRFVSAHGTSEGADMVQVILQDDRQTYTGAAARSSQQGESAEVTAVATATLRAVQQALGRRIPLTVRETQVIWVNDDRLCLSVVEAATGAGDERLSGTCFVVEEVGEAACKATLDAINRRIPVWASAAADGATAGDIAPALVPPSSSEL
jgi:hypothetical protein